MRPFPDPINKQHKSDKVKSLLLLGIPSGAVNATQQVDCPVILFKVAYFIRPEISELCRYRMGVSMTLLRLFSPRHTVGVMTVFIFCDWLKGLSSPDK